MSWSIQSSIAYRIMQYDLVGLDIVKLSLQSIGHPYSQPKKNTYMFSDYVINKIQNKTPTNPLDHLTIH